MKKVVLIIFIIFCSCFSDNNEISIRGEISGLNNSNIYLIKVYDNIVLDSSKVVNEEFNLTAYINEPRELALRIESKDSKKSFSFFSEPSSKIIFTTSIEKFEFNGKIENSSLNSEFEKLKIQLNKYDEKDLEMLGQQIEASIEQNKIKYDSLNKKRIKLEQKKILFVVNYCLNNNSNNLAPYMAYKYKENISENFLKEIYKNLSKDMKETYYGSRLISKP